MNAESSFDRVALILVTQNSRGSMGVNVMNLVTMDTRVTQGVDHATTWAIHIGRRHVVRITAHAKAKKLAINLCAPLFCMLKLLKNDHARAFSQNKAISVYIPGA